LRLGDALRPLRDPDAIVAAACRTLGEHLGASRVSYVDIDEARGEATPLPGWTDGITEALPGRIPVADYSPLLEPLRAGTTVRIDDHRAEAWLLTARAGLEALGVRAILSVPLRKDGALTGNLNVHHRHPRGWTDAEVELVEAVAERIWEAVERARAEADLRAREEELRLVTDALPGLVSHIGPDERYLYVNKLYEEWFGRSRATVIGRSVREMLGEESYARIKPRLDRAMGGERVRFEDRISYPDGSVRDLVADYLPAQGADGRIGGIFALIQDVSDVRRS
jgi:PAS domain S-box-containing protein